MRLHQLRVTTRTSTGAARRARTVPARPDAADDAGPEPSTRVPSGWRIWLGLAFPFLAFLGFRAGLGLTPLTIGFVLVAGLSVAFPRVEPPAGARSLLPLAGPAAALALAALALGSSQARWLLAWPVLINLALLCAFASTLFQGQPLVETIARRIDGELSETEVRYCRQVTAVWCAFFASNAGIAALLSAQGSLGAWTAYNGAIAYALAGSLFLAEFVVRKVRFRRFGTGWADRAALRVLGSGDPPPVPGSEEWIRLREKGSVRGIRFLWAVCRTLGRPVVRVLIRIVALYYTASDPRLRRASRAFLRRVGLRPTLANVYRQVRRFSYCVIDRMFLLSGQTEWFEFSREGDDLLRETLEAGQGALLVGAHFGSFEALRAAAGDDAFPLSIVGFFDNASMINSVLQTLAPDLAERVIHVDPEGFSHVMAIRERIRAGELVGFLGDRMTPGADGVPVRFFGEEVVFPTGAFQIAAALGCPVFLAFGVSRGNNRYQVHCERFREGVALPRASRTESLQAVTQDFADRLERVVRTAPDNWFNFYDFFGDFADADAANPVQERG